MFNLADKGNGQMYYPKDLSSLADAIINQEDMVHVTYDERDVTDLINWKWLFYLVLAMLSLEWFMRKRNGAY